MRYKFEDIAINSTAKKKPTAADKDTYLGLEHLDSGNLTVTRFGSDVAPIGEKLIMKKGDVLFGKRRAYQKKVAIAPFDGIFSAHGMVLRPKENAVDKNFFPLFISSDYFLDAAIKISVGSLSPTINWRDLKELEFNLPPLAEQRKLADLLWAANAAREAYKELLAVTDELVKAQFVEMFGDPVTNPMGWETTTINDAFPFISKGKPPKYVAISNIHVLNQACVYWDRIVFDKVKFQDANIETKAFYLFDGDLLLNSTGTGTLGRCNIFNTANDEVRYVADSHLTVLRGSENISPIFFKCFLGFEDIQRHLYAECVTGTTNQVDIVKEKLLRFTLPLPPIPLQNRFADFVRQADKSKLELQRTLDELDATYKAILRENLG